MPIFEMKRCYKNGKMPKSAIVYFEAKDLEEAYQAFGVGKFWSGYSERTEFNAQIVTELPKGCNVVNAKNLIESYKKEEEEYEAALGLFE